MQPLRESYIEKRFALLLEGWAKTRGIKLFCHKFEVPGRAGYPDRLVLCWPGQSIFIEFKRPGEKPRDLQLRIHELLREMGFTVLVHDDEFKALEDVQTQILTTISANACDGTDGAAGRVSCLLEAGAGEDGQRP